MQSWPISSSDRFSSSSLKYSSIRLINWSNWVNTTTIGTKWTDFVKELHREYFIVLTFKLCGELEKFLVTCLKDSTTSKWCPNTEPSTFHRLNGRLELGHNIYQIAWILSSSSTLPPLRDSTNFFTFSRLPISLGSKPCESCSTKRGFCSEMISSSMLQTPCSLCDTD